MWEKFASWTLKYRFLILIFLIGTTIWMGYKGKEVVMGYDFLSTVPADDEDMIYFEKFKKEFGEDGNLFAIGINDKKSLQLDNFNRLATLCKKIRQMEGIQEIISVTELNYLYKNELEKKFETKKLFYKTPQSQRELDSLLTVAQSIKLYEGRVLTKDGALLVVISIDKRTLNSSKRQILIPTIIKMVDHFSAETEIKVHYAGLPYVRTIMAGKVKDELKLFLWISLCVTGIIIFLFFKSIYPVIVPLLLVGVTIIWSLGTLALLNYKITLLTGLIPPLLVIVAIPNCIYLVNKYHQEFIHYGDKYEALKKVISKIGFVTVVTNLTTAIGFFVFISGDVAILKEFGITTGINTCLTFIISILLLPIVFSYLPNPDVRAIKHLDSRMISNLIEWLIRLTKNRRRIIYTATGIVLIISIWGTLKLEAIAYMVDDLPKNSSIKKDLAFFEKTFKGVMPLEIVIDTGRPNGLRKISNLQKIDSLETFLSQLPEVGKPVSLIGFVKASTQAYFNGDTSSYQLPSPQQLPFIYTYLKNNSKSSKGVLSYFTDSTGQFMRISLKVADVGSIKINKLIHSDIRPAIDSFFKGTSLKGHITGSTLLFIKGNDYLISSLKSGIWLAIILIAIAHGMLFMNLRIIIISLIPNLIPLVITTGLMGFLGIPLKPSTAIIFSIVLGIAVDNTVHFLARYRLELEENNFNIQEAISVGLRETGFSMIYTSIILFAGFIIFVLSDFGGTIALGALTSTTLLVALITNLTLLPTLLVSFDKESKRKMYT